MTSAETVIAGFESDPHGSGIVWAGRRLDGAHDDIIANLKRTAGVDTPWHLAVLQAVGEWSLPHEFWDDRDWRYVVGGEALDWLTLAQRLCMEIPHAVPAGELEALLFHGRFPHRIGPARFREMIGPYRYTAVLNFRYGVVVEEALQLVAEDVIRKNRLARCYQDSEEVVEDAFRHLYGETRDALLISFLMESGGVWGDDLERLSLSAWNEFTYWLFKRRVRKWHPARVASDTRRGLEKLRELQGGNGEPADHGEFYEAFGGVGDTGVMPVAHSSR